MFSSLIAKIFGTKYDRDIKAIRPFVGRINEIYPTLRDWSDEKFVERTNEFKKELAELRAEIRAEAKERNWDKDEFKKNLRTEIDDYLNEILPEAFAMVKETCRRLCGTSWDVCGFETAWEMVPYDVQLIGGIALHQGKIAEMATGEGKTLVATMPLYLNALVGDGVHLVTVNDYLAKRDSEWMGQVFKFLGLTVGCIQRDMDFAERRAQYACDITYGTNSEFGFDYLRDNMAVAPEYRVQRGHYFAIVDEVDSVLIDEARTPLIISGPVESSSLTQRFQEMQPLVERLVKRQTEYVNKIAADAERLFGEDKLDEAGIAMLSVQRGAPKNKRLLKLYKEQGAQKLAQKAELDLLREKRMHTLDEELFFVIDEKEHTINLTDKGRELLSPEDKQLFVLPDITEGLHEIDSNEALTPEQKLAEKERLYKLHAERADKNHAINQLLKAYTLYEKDVEYVVQEEKVLIVDEFTGRLMPGRRYSDGLHQAIEAKERVRVEGETQTVATITLQNYFRLYIKLAGMTGTAETEAGEFWEIYKLDVMVIPTNQPVRRIDFEDKIYRTKREKYAAIIEAIRKLHEKGMPVLVGTVSVEVSEQLSRMLKREKVPHNVLNAKFHQQEAEIVRDAGRAGTVTIATNMAGRGTDIKLEKRVVKREVITDEVRDLIEQIPDADGLKLADDEEPYGLHIIGTERHESRRIDRQLRGRAGRQGDFGLSEFYLSLEDDLMRLFGSDRIASVMDRLGIKEGEVIAHRMVTKAIERAQRRVETQNFSIRKHTLQYDDVMNNQRTAIYDRRNSIIDSLDHKAEIEEMIVAVAESIVAESSTTIDGEESVDLNKVAVAAQGAFLLSIDPRSKEWSDLTKTGLAEQLGEFALAHYHNKEAFLGAEIMRHLERYALLSTIDTEWKEHLYEMDQLKEGIGLRAYGQRDPLLEYKKEAFTMFEALLERIDRTAVSLVFKLQPVDRSAEQRRQQQQSRLRSVHESISGMRATAPQPEQPEETMPSKGHTIVREMPKVGRNDPCPCGSGKKYKKCHGAE
ncbi:MAG: preprotein translocase subunit SecA [candidate division Zixibacteria bacterium]|nr:preprotein translocase subunit SecA [candidate division Zixibacteria bacterium]